MWTVVTRAVIKWRTVRRQLTYGMNVGSRFSLTVDNTVGQWVKCRRHAVRVNSRRRASVASPNTAAAAAAVARIHCVVPNPCGWGRIRFMAFGTSASLGFVAFIAERRDQANKRCNGEATVLRQPILPAPDDWSRRLVLSLSSAMPFQGILRRPACDVVFSICESPPLGDLWPMT